MMVILGVIYDVNFFKIVNRGRRKVVKCEDVVEMGLRFFEEYCLFV